MADTIEITLDPSQAEKYIGDIRQSLSDRIAGEMDVVMQMFEERVRENLSGGVLQNRSGNLLSTVMRTPAQRSGDELYSSVQAGGDQAPYGIFFEEGGDGYYTIAPVNARVLSFMGAGGEHVFAMLVNHPPTPKLPWFAVEIPQTKDDMETRMNAVFEEVLSR